MTDSMKDRMIEAVEREGVDPEQAYDHVRESMADAADVKEVPKDPPLLTMFELATLNQARTILKRLDGVSNTRSYKNNAREYGRLGATADTAGDMIFDVLNWMNAARLQELPEEILFNREGQ